MSNLGPFNFKSCFSFRATLKLPVYEYKHTDICTVCIKYIVCIYYVLKYDNVYMSEVHKQIHKDCSVVAVISYQYLYDFMTALPVGLENDV